MSSAICLNLNQSKILSSANEQNKNLSMQHVIIDCLHQIQRNKTYRICHELTVEIRLY